MAFSDMHSPHHPGSSAWPVVSGGPIGGPGQTGAFKLPGHGPPVQLMAFAEAETSYAGGPSVSHPLGSVPANGSKTLKSAAQCLHRTLNDSAYLAQMC